MEEENTRWRKRTKATWQKHMMNEKDKILR